MISPFLLTYGQFCIHCKTMYTATFECIDTMPTTTFTTRIDIDLKEELEKIARMENRSASFMANQAIRSLVEERKATRELIELGLEMVEAGAPTIAPEDVHAWLMAEDENAPFPEAPSR